MRASIRLRDRFVFGLKGAPSALDDTRSRRALLLAHRSQIQGRIAEYEAAGPSIDRFSDANNVHKHNHATRFVYGRSSVIQAVAHEDPGSTRMIEIDSTRNPVIAATDAASLASESSSKFFAPSGMPREKWLESRWRVLQALGKLKDRRARSPALNSRAEAAPAAVVPCHEAEARIMASAILRDAECCVKHPDVLPIPLPGATPRSWELELVVSYRAAKLNHVLGDVGWRIFRAWLSQLMSTDAALPRRTVRVAWVQERIRAVVWRTGVEVKARSEEHSPRNDVQTTAMHQAKQALVEVANLVDELYGREWRETHRLSLECDSHFLFAKWERAPVPPRGRDRPAIEETAPLGSTTALAVLASKDVSTKHIPREPLVTVEVLLEKCGLPHDLVCSEVELKLQQIGDAAIGDRKTGGDAIVKVSSRAVTDVETHSFQLIRIENTTLRDVQVLKWQLCDGAAWEAPGVNDASDRFYEGFCAAVARHGVPSTLLDERSFGNAVVCRVMWRGNALVQKAHRDGFVRLTRKQAGRGRGYEDRKTGKVGSLRDSLRITMEDLDAARHRYFRLHRPRVVPGKVSAPLAVGDLYGFKYRTKLTSVVAADVEVLEQSLQRVRDDGFINYFGRQRFGPLAPKSVLPGMHLLRGEYRAAAHALIDVGESGDFTTVNENETRFNGTLRRLIQMLRATSDGGGSEEACRDAFVHGLGTAALRSMVAESVSLLWNSIASARVNQAGCFKLVEGDIVRPRARAAGEDWADAVATTILDEPVFVTADDIRQDRYTIHDLVLPIPGAGVVLPHNRTAGAILATLEAQGIHIHPEHRTWAAFHAHGNTMGLDFIGGYRYFLERPVTMSWRFRGAASDREDAKLRQSLRGAGASWARLNDREVELSYLLPASAYNWSMLRELTKTNNFSARDFQVVDAFESGAVPLSQLKDHEKHQYRNALKKSRTHFGTERMAMAKVQAAIFKSGGTFGLYPNKLIHGRGQSQ